MAKKNLTTSIALSKLVHVEMVKKNKEGKEIKGMFIPYDLNHLTLGKPDETTQKQAVYLNARIVYNSDKDQYENNGFIAKSLSKEDYEKLKDNEAARNEATPILGAVREWLSDGTAQDAAGDVGEGNVFNGDDDDDLPF